MDIFINLDFDRFYNHFNEKISFREIFHWLNKSHPGITFLQETHSIDEDETVWPTEWGGPIYFSNGSSQSRGVAILIPGTLSLDFKVVNETKDNEGRLLIVDCLLEDLKLTFINLYAPTKDHTVDQICFLTELNKILETNTSKNLIIGGDFNTQLNIIMDKKGGRKENQSRYSKYLESLMDEYRLIDIWRLRNPNKLRFTWREKTRGGFVQSRLDFFLVDESITYLIKDCFIKPGNKSDHSLVGIIFEICNTQKRGPGYWKFNNKLLVDRSYVSMVRKEIEAIKTEVIENKNTHWDYLKCKIRTITISYSKRIAKEKAKKETEMKQKLESLEIEISRNSEKINDYYQIKGIWEQMQSEKTEGVILRSRAKWTEHGEKNTRYFLNLEKRNYNIKHIKKLINNNGKEVIDPINILTEQSKFYNNFYSTRNLRHASEDSYLNNCHVPQLNTIEQSICDQNINIEEIAKALSELPNDKTPGCDGFTTNFYKFFWPDLKNLLIDTYRYTFTNGSLSNDQKRGIINIIPKEGKDLRYLRNWRPLSLFNTDYKILTKTLSNRLQSEQVGYIKGRYMGENIRLIKDLMTYTDNKSLPGYLLLIDFEKAFDSIEWPFLLECLECYNFGTKFQRWIQILYTDIQACVSNNGYLSQYFKLSRGIRQGCPISALLFILVAEILAEKVRDNKSIKGISINHEECKLCQLADDTTLFLSDTKAITQAISTLERFQCYSGLKINKEKTVIIPLGINRKKVIKLSKELQKLTINYNAFKTLGIWFSSDEEEMVKLNFENRIKKIENLLNI